MAGQVRECCLRLRERLAKEIARGPLPSKDHGDTTAIGGWGKIGSDLESLAAALFNDLVVTGGLGPAEAKREYGVGRKPTIGQWFEAVLDVARVAAKRSELSPLTKILVSDLAKDRMSVLFALANVRNRLQHDVPDRPSAQEAMGVLKRAIDFLSRAAP